MQTLAARKLGCYININQNRHRKINISWGKEGHFIIIKAVKLIRRVNIPNVHACNSRVLKFMSKTDRNKEENTQIYVWDFNISVLVTQNI